MIVGRFCRGEPLDLPPVIFFGVLNRAARVEKHLRGQERQEDIDADALARQLPDDWL